MLSWKTWPMARQSSKLLYQVAGQQEVCDPFADCVLMATSSTDQFPFHDLRLHEESVQVLKHLLIGLELLGRWWLIRQLGESKLGKTLEKIRRK